MMLVLVLFHVGAACIVAVWAMGFAVPDASEATNPPQLRHCRPRIQERSLAAPHASRRMRLSGWFARAGYPMGV